MHNTHPQLAPTPATRTRTRTRPRNPSLVNKATLRKFILDVAKTERHHPFTRVADSVYDEAEGVLRSWARNKVRQIPSKGKTIQ